MEDMGVNSYRFSISWARILPSTSLLSSLHFKQILLIVISIEPSFSLSVVNLTQRGHLEMLIWLELSTIISLLMHSYRKVNSASLANNSLINPK